MMISRNRGPLAWHQSAIRNWALDRKNSSHRRTSFPKMPAGKDRRVAAQRAVELQTQKMVGIQMRDPHRLRLHNPRRGLQAVNGPDGSTRNLQGDRSRFRQGTANHHQSAAGRDVNGGGKLQRISATSVARTDENRNGEL